MAKHTYKYPSKESSVIYSRGSPDRYFYRTFYEAKVQNERYPDFACSHEPYYLDLHELNFPDRDERGCGLVNMTVHVMGRNYRH